MTIPAPLFRYFQILLEALKKDIGAAQKKPVAQNKKNAVWTRASKIRGFTACKPTTVTTYISFSMLSII